MQVDRVGAALEQKPVPAFAGGQLLARQPGLLHGLLEARLLPREAVDGEADEDADDEIADHGDDVVPDVALMHVQEGDRGHQHRPERDDDAPAHTEEVGPGDDERRAEDLHDLEGQEERRHRIRDGQYEQHSAEATGAQSSLPGSGRDFTVPVPGSGDSEGRYEAAAAPHS